MMNKLLLFTFCAATLICITSAQTRVSYTFFQREAGDVVLYESTFITNLTVLPSFHDMWYTWESEEDIFTSIVLDLPIDVSWLIFFYFILSFLIEKPIKTFQ